MAAETFAQMPSLADGGAETLAWMRRMRDEQPLWVDAANMHHVFRYADVQAVMSDPARFSSNIGRILPGHDPEQISANLPWLDPPDHRRLRQLVSQAFAPKTVVGLRPRITEIAAGLLAAVPDGEFDFVERVAYPLPVIVVAELLGLPPADRAFFRDCADRLLGVGDAGSAEAGSAAIAEANRELREYLTAEAGRQRGSRSDGLIAALTAAELDGQRLSDVQVATIAGLLLTAGHITTTMVLGNALLCLRDNPEAEARTRADRSLVPAALEEVVRQRPPFPRVVRVSTQDVAIAGGVIPAQRLVVASTLSANHDERQFPDPERFDIDRHPNRHIGFGHGIHFCLGAPLARAETQIMLDLLFDEFAELRVVGEPVHNESEYFGTRKMTVFARRS
ncbi:cytochrome P450 [Actinomadura kijaniata]|uniref:p450 monooxygenase n=1 Tax=Actinomadura kijaniata TaxID=46161 RepID=B3TMN5_ACTKI|nr:cytochrome P450 [Actinomadura kijaniata]ACB46465.1 p450 monooxygenase [Actinomadura kijaniata]